MNNPLISIIIPSYNQGVYLQETILSILAQDYNNFEIIVIDGGSDDETIDIIKKYERSLAYWVSERDRGQSHAINKGFERASGEIVTWLNSDDVLLPGSLTKVAHAARQQNPGNVWVVGGLYWMGPQGRIIKCTRARPWWSVLASGSINVFGPSSFFSRRFLHEMGPVNENLHYMMDTELWMRFASAGYHYTTVPGYLWGLRYHPHSKMSGYLFSESQYADPKHSSWSQKEKERNYLKQKYPLYEKTEKKCMFFEKMRLIGSYESYLSLIDTCRLKHSNWSSVK